jgi:hypothetical protein
MVCPDLRLVTAMYVKVEGAVLPIPWKSIEGDLEQELHLREVVV